mmetsp:Transcript_88669/g.156975  ORF Transcript_88669/g.156975 Transcript_88669/m.156975 type:complete len:1226 (+) Transcript_88669:24-3701(+)
MKTMVAYLVAALWAVTLIGGAKAWSSSIRDGSVEASTLDSAAKAVIRDQEVGEDHEHHQLEHWCNVTVIAQTNRRSALLRLLVQSQSVSSGKDGGMGSDVSQLEKQAAVLGTSLEQERLAAQASESMQKQQIASLQLYMDDASKDVEALQRVWEQLGGAKANAQSPSAQVVAKLLVEAKKTVQERQAKLTWIQAGENGLGAANMSELESDYRNKKAAILNLEHQHYATQRSLDVLSSALEDESAYLSDLQSICSAEKRVHERLETRVLPALRGVPKLVAATPAAQEAPKAPETPAPPARAVKVTTTQPTATVAVAVAPKPSRKAPTLTTQAPAPEAEPVVEAAATVTTPQPEQYTTTTKKRMTWGKIQAVALKAKHVAATTSRAPPPATTTTQDALPEEDPGQGAEPVATPVTAAPSTLPPPAHHKKKAHHAVTLAERQQHKATPAPSTTPAPPAASEDSDFDLPSTTTSVPPVKKTAHPKKAAKKTKGGAAFIDGVYSSAAGEMPSAYTAWKPDGDASAPSAMPSTTVDVGKPTKPPVQGMKDLFDDNKGDDFDKDMTMLDTGSSKHTPATPAKKFPAKATVPPTTTTAPAETGEDSFNSKVIEASSPPPTTTAAASWQSMDMSTDTNDEAPTPEPRHKKKLRHKKQETFDDDDSDFDKDVKMLDTGTAALSGSPKQPAATPEPPAAPDTSFTTEEVPTPAPHRHTPTTKKKKLRGKKQDTFLDGVYNAAAGNLPTAYAAWSPDSTPSATSAPSQNSELKALEADFDSDDDTPTPAPKHRHKHRHHHDAPTPAPPVTHTMKGEDGVIYDDDDLPKHHRSSFSGLEGGWQSFMKKNKKKAKATKLDPDVAIMESLYTKDGGLPSQYTAWTPDSAPAAPKSEAPAKPKMFDDGDLAAAAKDFQNDDDSSFLQVASEDQSVDLIAHLIHEASISTGIHRRAFTSFLEVGASDSDKSGALAAGMVLDEFAEVLHSQPLRQLSKAHLSQSKLSDLFRQLRDVDPLTHNSNTGSAATSGKQAQAEQWCLYFQQHVESATPMQQAVARVEAASNELAKVVSHRAALLEEVNARKQLQRTVEKDVESLTALSKGVQQEPDARLHSFQQHLAARAAGGKAAAAVAAAAEGSHAGREELQDLLEGSLQKRASVVKAQRQKIADVQVEIKNSDVEVSKKKAEASSAQAGIETLRSKLSGIQASCNAALGTMEHRRHAGHMEAHAIDLALQVLASQ